MDEGHSVVASFYPTRRGRDGRSRLHPHTLERRAPVLLGHGGAPVGLIEERIPVLLGDEAEETDDVLGRAEFPRERLLIRLQEDEELLVAELLADDLEEQRTLVVEDV